MEGKVKLEGLDGVYDMLMSLPAELVSKRGGPVRVALRKGAVVIQKQAKANFTAAVNEPGLSGITQSTGFTAKNIVIKRKRPPPGVNGERFIVSVNYKVHPSGKIRRQASRRGATSSRRTRERKQKTVRANDIAFMMEYGTSKQPATPWLRPAFASKAAEAIRTVETELVSGVDRIARRLLKQGGA